MSSIEILGVIGFALAAYSVVANDAIQTLGTFLRSNQKRPWWILWLYVAGIFVAVLAYGYFTQAGDVAYGRLNTIPYPDGGIQWYHIIPPIALIALTRLTVPVSTTFLVLTMFALTGGAATEGVLGKMMLKSALGYAVAFGVGIVVYAMIARTFSRWVHNTSDHDPAKAWYTLKWLTTGFLWTQWLMQDLANIFVFLPRETVDGVVVVQPGIAFLGGALTVALLGYIFYKRGGRIQEIVNSKTGTQDPRVGVLVDLMFGIILFVFKEMNDIPMSTTWVFLGLIAGRELAVAYIGGLRDRSEAMRDVTRDAGRLLFGLTISVAIAFFVPWAATGSMPTF
ncbi:hypothetical protein GCM10007853_23450 [Algimonas ampicilliniresistens]|jgi:hypothetical protein|uniref:Phosphate/sulfate permease n=1 Tax=Algimonas ampicilliniresistens TaxID=1298735 RepID=A0ABQ5VD09_9PROT|nr:hypothetical protein [Algimonas ampicilliniresistens]GLQ24471.1 hypothetical protein GCM10007853_23450 [Algimonas ampicilliniresistens]